MLDQLVESNNHLNENKRRGGFLLTTLTAVTFAFAFALVYSLFSYNLAMANDRLDMSTLVAPVEAPADAPPEPANEPRRETAVKTIDKLPVRAANIQRVDEAPVKAPTDISTVKSSSQARPQSPFTIGIKDLPGSFSGNNPNGRSDGNGNNPTGIKQSGEASREIETAPPPVIKKIEPKPEPKVETPVKPKITSGGVVNGKAINLIKPPYPPSAKAVGASGTVNVSVLIDEDGSVTSANAVSGHQLLRHAAERAARATKFSPTYLSNQKVKVNGVIVYNFVAQ